MNPNEHYKHITLFYLNEVYSLFQEELKETKTISELEDLKKRYIGKKGIVTKIISDYNNKMKEVRLDDEPKCISLS